MHSAGLAEPEPRNGVPKKMSPRRFLVMSRAIEASSRRSPWTRISAATSPPRLCAMNIIGRVFFTPVSRFRD
jgi:hypothetical protein